MPASPTLGILSSWQQAWDLAQPRLHAIYQGLPGLPRVAPRVLRVGSLDAELLDQDLLQVLTEPLAKAIGLIQSSYRLRSEPELTLLVHLILYKFSVWDLGATYGAKLQNLRYKYPISSGVSALAPSGLPQRTLLTHATVTILIPYICSRLRVHALSRAWPDAPSSDIRRKVWNVLTRIESLHNALSLASFIAFICDGRYRTLTDRLMRLRLVPSQSMITRQVSYEFMNRQMVWHAFTEFLLFLLPLINTRVLRRRMIGAASHLSPARLIPPFARSTLGITRMTEEAGKETNAERRGKYWSLSQCQCAICAEDASFSIIDSRYNMYTASSMSKPSSSNSEIVDEYPQYPLNTPYVTSCLHHYCYVCLSERMLRAASDGEVAWGCLRCEAKVFNANRLVRGSAEEDRGDFDVDEAPPWSGAFITSK